MEATRSGWQLRQAAQAALSLLDAISPFPADRPGGNRGQLDRIGAAVRIVEVGQAELAAAVGDARAHGHSWTAIATQLGTSHQDARQRFGEH